MDFDKTIEIEFAVNDRQKTVLRKDEGNDIWKLQHENSAAEGKRHKNNQYCQQQIKCIILERAVGFVQLKEKIELNSS